MNQDTETKTRMAASEAYARLMQCLAAYDQRTRSCAASGAAAGRLIGAAIGVAHKVHRCGGATSGQLRELERLRERIKQAEEGCA